VNRLRVMRYAFENGWAEFHEDTWLPGWLLRAVAQAAFFAMLGQLIDSPERLEYLLIGNVVIVGALATAFVVPVSTWDRLDGTYPLMVAAPTSLLFPTVGRTLPRLMAGVATALLAYIVLSAAFTLPTPWPEVLALLPLLTLICLASYCFMLFVGALANFMPNARNLMHNIASMSLMAFCGVNVTVGFWPAPIEFLAQILPVTHGLEAVRTLLAAGSAVDVLTNAGLELLVAGGWLAVTATVTDRMANAGRASGSIEFVG
jgi:ABC-2 type transport system permease protein